MSDINWDNEVAWDIYREDLKSWSSETLVRELQLITNELKIGLMTQRGYDRAKDFIESQIIERMDTNAQSTAYDAAMKGI